MKKVFAAVFFMAASFVIHAQSMESISQIVESPVINYGQAAYLALTYSGGIDEGATESEALYEAVKKDWIKSGASDVGQIRLGELCALYAKAAGIKGGLFCRLTKNSARYSFKEFKALGLLDKAADPSMTVSGQNALSLFNSCIQAAEGSK